MCNFNSCCVGSDFCIGVNDDDDSLASALVCFLFHILDVVDIVDVLDMVCWW